jgi:uncharacterized protein
VGGLQLVQSYGEGGFKVSGRRYTGSILVLPDVTQSWPIQTFADLALPGLTPIMDAKPPVDLLVIGCGVQFSLAPVTLREVLKSKGIGVETMDTGAACRTYNVLAGEGRRVGAALVAV